MSTIRYIPVPEGRHHTDIPSVQKILIPEELIFKAHFNFRSGVGFVDFRPGIAQGDGAIEHQIAAFAVFDKVTDAFELIRGTVIRLCERGFQFALIENL